jgi:uncharacterized membrane protein (TIGR02234 family)
VSNARAWFAAALIADLLGATGTLLTVGRTWQRVVVSRQAPLADAVVHLSGRDIDAAISGLSFVALAGVVAIAATRGLGRRLVGGALASTGLVIGWLSIRALSPVSATRARASVPSGVGVNGSSGEHVHVIGAWPLLTLVWGLLIALAGVLTVVFAARWSGLTARYEAPTAAAQRELPATEIAMWRALDRGDDPTARTEP